MPSFGEKMASHLSRKSAVVSPTIPDRLYFKIGDVARICGVETYVLRFWETEFPQLKPNKSGTGQRLYRRRDVDLALEIKRLGHSAGYTLSGARQVMELVHRRRQTPAAPAPEAAQPSLRNEAAVAAVGRARVELREIAALLAAPPPRTPRPRARLVTARPDSESLFPL